MNGRLAAQTERAVLAWTDAIASELDYLDEQIEAVRTRQEMARLLARSRRRIDHHLQCIDDVVVLLARQSTC